MKMYKQRNTQGISFSMYEVIRTGSELLTRSGDCGEKIKENTKSYASEADAMSGLKKVTKNKLNQGFFECEGDDANPFLNPPVGMPSAPEEFEERISTLAESGVYLSPSHHRVEDALSAEPIFSTSMDSSGQDNGEPIKSILMESEILQEKLNEYKEIDLQNCTIDELNKALVGEDCKFYGWKIVDSENIGLGIVKKFNGVDSIDLYLDLMTEEKNKEFDFSLVQITTKRVNYVEPADIIEEYLLDAEDLTLSQMAQSCIKDCSKVRAEIINWLFNDCTVDVYEITTSPTYAIIGRFQSLKVYVINNHKTNKTHFFFFDMFYEC